MLGWVSFGQHVSIHADSGRAHQDNKDAWEDKDNQRKDHLYSGLGSFFFGDLTTFGPHRITMYAKCSCDTGTKLVSLDQNRCKLLEVINTTSAVSYTHLTLPTTPYV